MSTIRILCCALGVTLAVGVFYVVHSQAPEGFEQNIVLEKIQRSYGPSNEILMLENIRERIAPDGSRSLTKLRAVPSRNSATGWEATELRTIYNANENVTYNLFPALGMYGSLPIGNHKYKPIIPSSECVGVLSDYRVVERLPSSSKFGRKVEVYRLEVDGPKLTHKRVERIEMFPEFGCLLGNEFHELQRKGDDTVISRGDVQLLSLSVVPHDSAEFVAPAGTITRAKPSEILRKHYELMNQDCPECVLDTGARSDLRHDRLWAEREKSQR
jgi:hypothetical protein